MFKIDLLPIDFPLMAHLIQCGGHNPEGEDYHLVWGQECFEYFLKLSVLSLCNYVLTACRKGMRPSILEARTECTKKTRLWHKNLEII